MVKIVEAWSVEIAVRAVLKDVERITKDIKTAVEKGISGAGGAMGDIFKGAGGTFRSLLSALPRLPSELMRAMGGLSGIMKGAIAGFPGGIGGIGVGAVAVLTAILMTLKNIAELVKQAINTFAKASPLLAATRDIMTKIWSYTLRPFGDFLAVLLRPVMIFMLAAMRKFVAAAKPTIEAVQAGTMEAGKAWEEISKLFYDIVLQPLRDTGVFDILQRMGMDVYGTLSEFKAISGDAIGAFETGIEGWLVEVKGATGSFVTDLSTATARVKMALTDPEGFKAQVDAAKEAVKAMQSEMISRTVPYLSLLSGNLAFASNAISDFVSSAVSAAKKLSKIEVSKPKNIFEQIWDVVTGGPKQFGGSIAHTGLYQLHAGEYVIPRERAGGMGGNVSITINNPSVRKDSDINELVRQISHNLQLEERRRVSYGVF